MTIIPRRISLGDQTGRKGWTKCVAACRDDKLIIPLRRVKVKVKFTLEQPKKASEVE
jgi:hypothetical protein